MQVLSIRIVINYRPAFRYTAGACRPVCHGGGLHKDPGRRNAGYPINYHVFNIVFSEAFYVDEIGTVAEHIPVT